MTSLPPKAQELLDVWFGDDLDSLEGVSARSAQWFGGGEAFDEMLRSRFADLPRLAGAGELGDWRDGPRSALALVLVLDQLPRNLFRNSSEAFAYDAIALEVAREIVARQWEGELHPVERAFVYLPFEHAEDREVQAQSVALYTALCEQAPSGLAEVFARYLDYAKRHQVVIDRFGRFPHRNVVLGRESTAPELKYLADGGDTF